MGTHFLLAFISELSEAGALSSPLYIVHAPEKRTHYTVQKARRMTIPPPNNVPQPQNPGQPNNVGQLGAEQLPNTAQQSAPRIPAPGASENGYGYDQNAQAPYSQQPYAQPMGNFNPYSQYPQEPVKKKAAWPWIAGGSALLAIIVVLALVLVFALNGKEASTQEAGASQSAAAQSASGPKLPRYAPAGAKDNDKVKVKAVAKYSGEAYISYGTSESFGASNSTEESSSGEFSKEAEITRQDGYTLYVGTHSREKSAEVSCSISVNDVEVSRYSAQGPGSNVYCHIPLEHMNPETYEPDYMRKDDAHEEEVTIEAKVTSNGTVDIGYGPLEGENHVEHKGEWSTTVKQKRRESYEVEVNTYVGDATEVSCTILVNGEEVAKNSASGKDSSVSCSIPFEKRYK